MRTASSADRWTHHYRLADEICGGIRERRSQPRNGRVVGRYPDVLAPGCVDMANFGGVETVPERYLNRNPTNVNRTFTLLRTNVEENRWMGAKISPPCQRSDGSGRRPTPVRGVSMLDRAATSSGTPVRTLPASTLFRWPERGHPIIEVTPTSTTRSSPGKPRDLARSAGWLVVQES